MRPPIKLLHLITGLGGGGAEVMLYKLLSGLDRDRFEASVISLGEKGTLGPRIEALGIPVAALGMRASRPRLSDWTRLRALIRQARPDLVQTWMYHADLLGGLAARSLGVRAVVWNIRQTTLDASLLGRRTRALVRLCALLSRRLPARILCCAHAARDTHVAAGYAPDKIEVIPNGFDVGRFCRDEGRRAALRGALGVEDGTIVVGHVARFNPYKDHRTLAEAAGAALRADPRLRFVCVGEGVTDDNTELAAWLAQSGARPFVHLLGARADVRDLYSMFDLYVSSSMGEGFPNVVGEAMACELPCVVTDVGDSALLVAETGIVVPPADPRRLADALVALAGRSVEARRALGRRARARVEEGFSLTRVVEQYQEVYTRVQTSST